MKIENSINQLLSRWFVGAFIAGSVLSLSINSSAQTRSRSDLEVVSIASSPSVPVVGNHVRFTATIRNRGTASTPSRKNIRVLFSVNGQRVSWGSVSTSLAPGATLTLIATNGPNGVSTWQATAGTHMVSALVDDLNRIGESNESNNQLSQSLTVGNVVTTTTLSPPTTTTLPTPQASIPMTALEWKTEYDGYGFVTYESTNQSVTFAPMASTNPGETHATLLLSKRHLSQPARNFRITVVATTEKQLRTPTPNAWEVFWLFFNYTIDGNGKKITNYFTMKPNGIELGRAHDELGQNFLATATSPILQIGLPNKYVIEKIGGKLQVFVDGKLIMNYDSATGPYPLYDNAGTIGLYSEDARVRVHSVSVEPL